MSSSLDFLRSVLCTISLGFLVIALWVPSQSIAIEKDSIEMNRTNLDEQGKKLRAEIETYYRELKKQRNWLLA